MKIAELIGHLNDVLEGYGDREVWNQPEPEPGSPQPVIPLRGNIHFVQGDPERGDHFTLG